MCVPSCKLYYLLLYNNKLTVINNSAVKIFTVDCYLLLFHSSTVRLVVVSRFHPEPVLMSLIHFVAPSRPVVVYSNILEVRIIFMYDRRFMDM